MSEMRDGGPNEMVAGGGEFLILSAIVGPGRSLLANEIDNAAFARMVEILDVEAMRRGYPLRVAIFGRPTMLSDNLLVELDRNPAFMTAERVWERMRDSCCWQGFTHEDCARHEEEYAPCAFATCPLLKEAKQ